MSVIRNHAVCQIGFAVVLVFLAGGCPVATTSGGPTTGDPGTGTASGDYVVVDGQQYDLAVGDYADGQQGSGNLTVITLYSSSELRSNIQGSSGATFTGEGWYVELWFTNALIGDIPGKVPDVLKFVWADTTTGDRLEVGVQSFTSCSITQNGSEHVFSLEGTGNYIVNNTWVRPGFRGAGIQWNPD